ncbi:hypothetical protein OY671_009385, partial [Metschnikowia pulcherrima]
MSAREAKPPSPPREWSCHVQHCLVSKRGRMGNKAVRGRCWTGFVAFFVQASISITVPANEYRDNPSQVLDLSRYSQFSFVGRLERDIIDETGLVHRHQGSAVVVSPCYIITNRHVVFGDDETPIPAKSYPMTFRAGVGDDDEGFLGHTEALPVLWGKASSRGDDDWAIMRLHRCVGQHPA